MRERDPVDKESADSSEEEGPLEKVDDVIIKQPEKKLICDGISIFVFFIFFSS
jgi:hypothetical protein